MSGWRIRRVSINLVAEYGERTVWGRDDALRERMASDSRFAGLFACANAKTATGMPMVRMFSRTT